MKSQWSSGPPGSIFVDAERRRVRHARIERLPRVEERRRAVGERRLIRACSGSSGSRLKSPVMIVDAGRRYVWNGPPVVSTIEPRARGRALGVDRAQRLDLRRALHFRVVLEMRRDHAHFAERRDDARLDRDSRHSVDAGVDRGTAADAGTPAAPAAATGSCCRSAGAARPRPDDRPRSPPIAA